MRRQLRGEHGRVGSVEYTIYEKPQTPPPAPSGPDAPSPSTGSPDTASPCTGFPDTVKPDAVLPDADVPDTENPAQLNTKKTNPCKKQNTYRPNTHSFCLQPPPGPGSAPPAEGMTEVYEKRDEIRDQIEYDLIADSANREQINELVEIMLEVALYLLRRHRHRGRGWRGAGGQGRRHRRQGRRPGIHENTGQGALCSLQI